MKRCNIEIKARCTDPGKIEHLLNDQQAQYLGVDHQIDTYFEVAKGRLKLREGTIENALIHYDRPNKSGPKRSDIILYRSQSKSTLKEVLLAALKVKVIVDKKRAIYFVDNVKFHLDEVQGLGSFVEIEAIDKDGSIGESTLLEQCQYFIKLFGIQDEDLVNVSYSDLMLSK